AAAGRPAAASEQVLLAIKWQVIEVLGRHDFDADRGVKAVAFDQSGGPLGADDPLALIGRMSVLGILVDPHAKVAANDLKRFDFVIADELQAFAFLFGKIEDLFVARKVCGELAVIFARTIGPAVLSLLLGIFDDLFGVADRFLQSTDDFRRGFL